MRKFLFGILCVHLLLSSCQQQKNVKHILFIGNSYTYRNNMPNYFTNLCSERGEEVSVTYVTKGKYTFSLQRKRKQVLVAINSKKWDVIVLQGASRDMLRDSTTLNTKTLPAIHSFVQLFKKEQTKAKVFLFMTWPYEFGYAKNKKTFTANRMIKEIALGYQKIKEKYQINIIPIGLLWNEVRLKRKDIQLYEEDRAHPTTFGSFLTAHCLYRSIFKDTKTTFRFSISRNKEKERFLQKYASHLISEEKYADWIK